MARETWKYLNETTQIQINRISNHFSSTNVLEEGDAKKGQLNLFSTTDADEVWGPEAKIDINWEEIDPSQYHQGLKVKETIRMFSEIEVFASKKENKWHLSHEMTIWWGNRQQVKHRRFYTSKIMHGIVFCELTHRLFEIHAICLGNQFQKYEKTILDIIDSLQCHGS